MSPTQLACMNDGLECFRLLIKHGASIQMWDTFGDEFPAVFVATQNNSCQVLKELLFQQTVNVFDANNGRGASIFHVAAQCGYSNALRCIYHFLVKNNYNSKLIDQFINKRSPLRSLQGETPYIAACKKQKPKAIKILVKVCKVDVSIPLTGGKYGSDFVVDKKLRVWLKRKEKEMVAKQDTR